MSIPEEETILEMNMLAFSMANITFICKCRSILFITYKNEHKKYLNYSGDCAL